MNDESEEHGFWSSWKKLFSIRADAEREALRKRNHARAVRDLEHLRSRHLEKLQNTLAHLHIKPVDDSK